MKVDSQLVDKIASLSKLQFDEQSKTEIISDLQRMLEFVDKLSELDTEGVEPQIYISEATTVLRADDVQGELSKADALKNAPLKDSDYFKVPKVISKDEA